MGQVDFLTLPQAYRLHITVEDGIGCKFDYCDVVRMVFWVVSWMDKYGGDLYV